MSTNIWNKANQKLVKVSGNAINNINDESSSQKDTWSAKKISDELGELDTKVDELDEKYFGGFKTTQFPTSEIVGIGTVASNEWSYNDYFVKVKFDVICNVPTDATGWISNFGNASVPTELKASTDKYLACMYQRGNHYYPGLFVISSTANKLSLFTSESTSGNVTRVSVNGDYLK